MTDNLPSTHRQKKAPPPNLVKQMLQPLARAEKLHLALSENVRAKRAFVPFGLLPRSQILVAPEVEIAPLIELSTKLRSLVSGETDAPTARAGFVLMISALPNAAKFDASVFLDALVASALIEPGGFPATIIAAGVQRIWRERTFTPSIAEVLEVLRAERKRLLEPVLETDSLIERIEELQRMCERQRQELAEFHALREKARAAGDQSFDVIDDWEFDQQLERLRWRYGKALA